MQTVRKLKEPIFNDNQEVIGSVVTRITRGWGSNPKYYITQKVTKRNSNQVETILFPKQPRSLSWASRWFNQLVG